MQAQAAAESPYGKGERWQLPGLTGQDAFQAADWQSFRTKVEDMDSQGKPNEHCLLLATAVQQI